MDGESLPTTAPNSVDDTSARPMKSNADIRRQSKRRLVLAIMISIIGAIGVIFLGLSLGGVIGSRGSGSPVLGEDAGLSDAAQGKKSDENAIDPEETPPAPSNGSSSTIHLADSEDQGGEGVGSKSPSEPAFSKTKWPEVVGMPVQAASDIILADTDYLVTIQVVPYGSFVTTDFVPDRVRIFASSDPQSTVVESPQIG